MSLTKEKNQQKPPKKSRWKKFFLYTFSFFFIVYIFRAYLLSGPITWTIETIVEKTVGISLTIDKFHGTYFSDIIIEKIHLNDGGDLLKELDVEKIYVSYNLLNLFRGGRILTEVSVKNPRIHALPPKMGKKAPEDPSSGPLQLPDIASYIAISPDISIDKANLAYSDQGMLFAIQDLTLESSPEKGKLSIAAIQAKIEKASLERSLNDFVFQWSFDKGIFKIEKIHVDFEDFDLLAMETPFALDLNKIGSYPVDFDLAFPGIEVAGKSNIDLKEGASLKISKVQGDFPKILALLATVLPQKQLPECQGGFSLVSDIEIPEWQVPRTTGNFQFKNHLALARVEEYLSPFVSNIDHFFTGDLVTYLTVQGSVPKADTLVGINFSVALRGCSLLGYSCGNVEFSCDLEIQPRYLRMKSVSLHWNQHRLLQIAGKLGFARDIPCDLTVELSLDSLKQRISPFVSEEFAVDTKFYMKLQIKGTLFNLVEKALQRFQDEPQLSNTKIPQLAAGYQKTLPMLQRYTDDFSKLVSDQEIIEAVALEQIPLQVSIVAAIEETMVVVDGETTTLPKVSLHNEILLDENTLRIKDLALYLGEDLGLQVTGTVGIMDRSHPSLNVVINCEKIETLLGKFSKNPPKITGKFAHKFHVSANVPLIDLVSLTPQTTTKILQNLKLQIRNQLRFTEGRFQDFEYKTLAVTNDIVVTPKEIQVIASDLQYNDEKLCEATGVMGLFPDSDTDIVCKLNIPQVGAKIAAISGSAPPISGNITTDVHITGRLYNWAQDFCTMVSSKITEDAILYPQLQKIQNALQQWQEYTQPRKGHQSLPLKLTWQTFCLQGEAQGIAWDSISLGASIAIDSQKLDIVDVHCNFDDKFTLQTKGQLRYSDKNPLELQGTLQIASLSEILKIIPQDGGNLPEVSGSMTTSWNIVTGFPLWKIVQNPEMLSQDPEKLPVVLKSQLDLELKDIRLAMFDSQTNSQQKIQLDNIVVDITANGSPQLLKSQLQLQLKNINVAVIDAQKNAQQSLQLDNVLIDMLADVSPQSLKSQLQLQLKNINLAIVDPQVNSKRDLQFDNFLVDVVADASREKISLGNLDFILNNKKIVQTRGVFAVKSQQFELRNLIRIDKVEDYLAQFSDFIPLKDFRFTGSFRNYLRIRGTVPKTLTGIHAAIQLSSKIQQGYIQNHAYNEIEFRKDIRIHNSSLKINTVELNFEKNKIFRVFGEVHLDPQKTTKLSCNLEVKEIEKYWSRFLPDIEPLCDGEASLAVSVAGQLPTLENLDISALQGLNLDTSCDVVFRKGRVMQYPIQELAFRSKIKANTKSVDLRQTLQWDGVELLNSSGVFGLKRDIATDWKMQLVVPDIEFYIKKFQLEDKLQEIAKKSKYKDPSCKGTFAIQFRIHGNLPVDGQLPNCFSDFSVHLSKGNFFDVRFEQILFETSMRADEKNLFIPHMNLYWNDSTLFNLTAKIGYAPKEKTKITILNNTGQFINEFLAGVATTQQLPFTGVCNTQINIEGYLPVADQDIDLVTTVDVSLASQEGKRFWKMDLGSIALWSRKQQDQGLNVSLKIQGQRNNPKITGKIDFNLERMRIVDQNISVNDVRFVADFSQYDILIDARAQMGGGPITCQGKITHENKFPKKIDLTIKGSRVLLIRTEDLLGRADIDLKFIGNVRKNGNVPKIAANFSGVVDITEFDVSTRMSLNGSPERASGGGIGFESDLIDINLDLQVLLSKVAVHNNLAEIITKGKIEVKGTAAQPKIRGFVRTTFGKLFLPQGNMNITECLVVLKPENPFNPNVNVVAETQVRDYRIIVSIKGTPTDLSIEFSSEPNLPPEDIITLLLTGGTVSDLQQSGGQKLQETGSFIITQQILNALGIGNYISAQITTDSATVTINPPTWGGFAIQGKAETAGGTQLNVLYRIRFK